MNETLNHWVRLDPLHSRVFLSLQDLLYFKHTLHADRHASQLHLHDVFRGRLEDRFVDRLLVIVNHLRLTLVVDVPRRQGVHEVVLQQLWQRDTPDVLDVIVGHGVVASKLVSLLFKPQFVPGTGVGRQIGDQLGAVPVLQHHVQAFKQTFLIKDVIHEQLVRQDVGVESDVVVDGTLLVQNEELLEHYSNWFVLDLLAVELHFLIFAGLLVADHAGPLFLLVVHSEGNALMLIPSE